MALDEGGTMDLAGGLAIATVVGIAYMMWRWIVKGWIDE